MYEKKYQELGRNLRLTPSGIEKLQKGYREHGRTDVPGSVLREAERREENM